MISRCSGNADKVNRSVHPQTTVTEGPSGGLGMPVFQLKLTAVLGILLTQAQAVPHTQHTNSLAHLLPSLRGPAVQDAELVQPHPEDAANAACDA